MIPEFTRGLLATSLTVCVLAGPTVAVASASGAAERPAIVNIEDPANDANGVNDQGARYYTGERGDQQTPVNVDGRGDLLAVWFTNTATTVSMHVQTAAKSPTPGTAYGFRVYANPSGEQPDGCTIFQAVVAGPTWQGETQATIRDLCINPGPGNPPLAEGEVTTEAGPDETSILTMSFVIGSASMIEMCDSVVKPWADTRFVSGPASPFFIFPVLDNTKKGVDHQLRPAPQPSRKKKTKKAACPSVQ